MVVHFIFTLFFSLVLPPPFLEDFSCVIVERGLVSEYFRYFWSQNGEVYCTTSF